MKPDSIDLNTPVFTFWGLEKINWSLFVIKLYFFSFWIWYTENTIICHCSFHTLSHFNHDFLKSSWCCPHIETSQFICPLNQWTGFYMRATMAFIGLSWIQIQSSFVRYGILTSNSLSSSWVSGLSFTLENLIELFVLFLL